MKKINYALTILAFCSLTASAFAADEVTKVTADMQPIATVSVFGAKDPESLSQLLAKKATEVGATKYKIISSSSNDNSERGTAVAYR